VTADLLTALPIPAPPVELQVCSECGYDFPPVEVEFFEPLGEWLCLDDVAAEVQRWDDRRAADNYYYG
jgi:hypothetical protein